MKYIIQEHKKFAKALRKEAVAMLSDESYKELDTFITIPQCCDILNNHCVTDEDNNDIIDGDIYMNVISDIATQIYHSALSKLAADDIINQSWNIQENKFDFWIDVEEGEKKIDYTPHF